MVKSEVTYAVPSWSFCNSDNVTSKATCRFCTKDHRCLLYNKPLSMNGDLIYKLPECCNATAGDVSVINSVPPQQQPVINPSEIVKQTINLYTKTLRDLQNQGYPAALAEQAAKQFILKGDFT